jgi:hypothetical protein
MVPIIEGRENFVINRCIVKRGSHICCVDGGLKVDRLTQCTHLHLRLREVASDVVGIDMCRNGLNILREYGYDLLIEGNVEKLSNIPHLGGYKFDVILATEIIELLNNPGLFLEGVKQCFNDNTEIIITTPNALRITGMYHQWRGYGFVHPDHTCWFSCYTLSNLHLRYQYKISEFYANRFYDIHSSLLKKYFDNLTNKKEAHSRVHRNEGGSRKTNSLSSPSHILSYMLNILFRRSRYKRNPFFQMG